MLELTLDVCVLMGAWGLSNHRPTGECLRVVKRMADEDGWAVALDKKGRIRQQYEDKLGREGDGLRWLGHMVTKGKCVFVETRPLPTQTRALIHKEDKKYVETAAVTECKLLVSYRSHPSNYGSRICRELRRIGVRVMEPGSACKLEARGTRS